MIIYNYKYVKFEKKDWDRSAYKRTKKDITYLRKNKIEFDKLTEIWIANKKIIDKLKCSNRDRPIKFYNNLQKVDKYLLTKKSNLNWIDKGKS